MTIPLEQRFRILDRDGYTCQFCGKHAPETELEVDHVWPRSKGGDDSEDNLVAACRDCNRGKSDRIAYGLESRRWRSLEGKFFHRIAKDGYINWQGQILSDCGNGHYIVQLFEWISGGPSWSGIRLLPISMMIDYSYSDSGFWAFYLTAEEMNEAYEHGSYRYREIEKVTKLPDTIKGPDLFKSSPSLPT